MGFHAYGILAYGYNLGSHRTDEGWLVEETNISGGLDVGWFNEEDQSAHFPSALEQRLLASAGFTETDTEAAGYHRRKEEAWQRTGVTLWRHGFHEQPQYLLTTEVIRVEYGDVKELDLLQMATRPSSWSRRRNWRAQLAAALAALELTPWQDGPQWLLCASYT